MPQSAEARVVTNTLTALPGCRDWIRIGEVAELIVADLKSSGAEITWPNGEPDVPMLSRSDVAFKRLVEMDRANR